METSTDKGEVPAIGNGKEDFHKQGMTLRGKQLQVLIWNHPLQKRQLHDMHHNNNSDNSNDLSIHIFTTVHRLLLGWRIYPITDSPSQAILGVVLSAT